MRAPQIVTYVVREKVMDHKGEQIWYNHDVSIGAVAVGENTHLRTSNVEQWKKSKP